MWRLTLYDPEGRTVWQLAGKLAELLGGLEYLRLVLRKEIARRGE